MRNRTMGMVILYHLSLVLLLEMILNWLCIWTILMLFLTMLLLLLLNFGCNNFVDTLMYENYLWTYCNMWLVVLNHVRSWLVCWLNRDPSWYSTDYWIYMGSSVMVWLPWWLLLYLCSYKLDGSITAGIGARFNTKLVIWVFKTKVCFIKSVWQLIAIYIGVSKSNF